MTQMRPNHLIFSGEVGFKSPNKSWTPGVGLKWKYREGKWVSNRR
jgi:hypothetical protein